MLEFSSQKRRSLLIDYRLEREVKIATVQKRLVEKMAFKLQKPKAKD
jgi:hypothetical protein